MPCQLESVLDDSAVGLQFANLHKQLLSLPKHADAGDLMLLNNDLDRHPARSRDLQVLLQRREFKMKGGKRQTLLTLTEACGTILQPRLNSLLPVLMSEVAEDFSTCLRVEAQYFEPAYQLFVGSVLRRIAPRQGKVLEVDLVNDLRNDWDVESLELDETPDDRTWKTWHDGLGFELLAEIIRSEDPFHSTNEWTAEVLIRGQFSEQAWIPVFGRLRPVVQTLLRNVTLVRAGREVAMDLCWMSEERDVLRVCLDLLFRDTPTRKALGRRIRTALESLLIADQQTEPALRLAMAVVAVEAAVGQDKQQVQADLSLMSSLLLEPQEGRRPAAIRAVKRIYDSRCAILHGRDFRNGVARLDEARLLAAALLHAVIDYWLAEGETPAKNFKAAVKRHTGPGLPQGIMHRPECRFWT